MALSDYLVPFNQRSNELCFNCKNACGGCSWSALDPATNKPKYEPVPGWTAKKVMLKLGISHAKVKWVQTYHITACPQYEPDRKRRCAR